MKISVLMPAYNAAAFLDRSLPPLVAMLRAGEVHEILLIDDGSDDDTVAIARGHGARVIPSGGRRGPGGARNVGAKVAAGDALWFVDADVVVKPDGPGRIRAALGEGYQAVFGSYDASPPERNFGSKYKNLVHHHYHQIGAREADTFWAGCGAVLKEAFLAVGGFDAEKYRVPSIEDIELGYRLRDAGMRICLDRDLMAAHLKRWDIAGLIATDVMKRALPWSRLILRRPASSAQLNISGAERARALIAAAIVLAAAGAVAGLVPWAATAILLGLAFAANLRLLGVFMRHSGIGFAVAGILLHQIYYLYAMAAYGWCRLELIAARLKRHARL